MPRVLNIPPVEVPDDNRYMAVYAMKHMGVSCEQVGALAGHQASYVGKMLRGDIPVKQHVRDAVVEALGGHWDESTLFDREPFKRRAQDVDGES